MKKGLIFAFICCHLPLQTQSITQACWGTKSECIDFLGTNLTCSKLEQREYILPRLDPGEVGSVTKLKLIPGRTHLRMTRGKKPPIFEIPNFLTDEECDYLIKKARSRGLEQSGILAGDGVYVKPYGSYSRRGEHCFLVSHSDPRLRYLQQRISSLSGVPNELLDESEGFQVSYYEVEGHYSCHHDSSKTSREQLMVKPCCHQFLSRHSLANCVLCRYITVLMYLNDVEEGGETVFPIADKESLCNQRSDNLTETCQHASVIVKPEKGKAIMWYNNNLDPETGWLGILNPLSYHCGCPVKRGKKWISNFWISVPQYDKRYDNSIYAIRWK